LILGPGAHNKKWRCIQALYATSQVGLTFNFASPTGLNSIRCRSRFVVQDVINYRDWFATYFITSKALYACC